MKPGAALRSVTVFGVLALVSSIVVAAEPDAAKPRRDPRATSFSYFDPYCRCPIKLEASTRYAASLAVDGVIGTPPAGFVLDRRSQRADLAARGIALFVRVPPAPVKGLARPVPHPAWIDALPGTPAAQPVFELGGALKIPSDELLVGLWEDATDDQVKDRFEAFDGLGIARVERLRSRMFRVTIDDAVGGRVFEVARELAQSPRVVFAEPNFVDLWLETPRSGFEQRPAAGIAFFDPPHPVEVPPGGRMIASWDKPSYGVNWQPVILGDFESIASDWTVAHDATAALAEPVVTTYRAHGGKRSVYMTGRDLAGQRAPGPYNGNLHTYLVSPVFSRAGYDDLWFELWYWADVEDPLRDPPYAYDLARVRLVDAITWATDVSIPLAPGAVSGNLAEAAGTDRGWRRLLYRVPVELGDAALRLVVEFESDADGGREGLYVDDVVVLGEKVVKPARPPCGDPLAPLQYALVPAEQLAGRPAFDAPFAAAKAWGSGAVSETLTVALIDDGVEGGHPDLNVVAADGEHALPAGDPVEPGDRHGTACAGLIAARADNNAGVAGIAPGTRLLPLRRGIDDASLVQAIDDAVRLRAQVVVLPWGWTGAPSAALARAIADATAGGAVVIAAAGDAGVNEPFSAALDFPCSLGATSALVCVGAADLNGDPKTLWSVDGQPWWWSATSRDGPDVIAPGTWLHTTDRFGPLGYNAGDPEVTADWTQGFSGTGAAACLAAGVAALVRTRDPLLSSAEVKALLIATSLPRGLATARAAAPRLLLPDAAVRAAVESAERREQQQKK